MVDTLIISAIPPRLVSYVANVVIGWIPCLAMKCPGVSSPSVVSLSGSGLDARTASDCSVFTPAAAMKFASFGASFRAAVMVPGSGANRNLDTPTSNFGDGVRTSGVTGLKFWNGYGMTVLPIFFGLNTPP